MKTAQMAGDIFNAKVRELIAEVRELIHFKERQYKLKEEAGT